MSAGPSTGLHVEVFGVDLLHRQILRKIDHVKDFRPAFRRIRDRLQTAAKRQFDTEGGYGSGGWPPLAESTIERKRAAGQSSRILIATGALRDSLAGRGTGHTERFSSHAMQWGSSIPYGRYHMTGTSRMPRREPLNIPEAERRNIMKELQEHIATTART